LVRKLREQVVQNVKNVVLVGMVLVAKHVTLVNIAPLLWTILNDVPTAVLESLNQILGKQAASPVYLGHTKINLANRYAKTAKQDCFVEAKMPSVVHVQVVGYQQKTKR
jgi:hypothetical protein